MQFLITIFIFLLGTIIGSFLNVVILRYNTGKKIFDWGERSMCFSCGKELQWYELVPVVSFLALRGKCRGCKSKISWQYPLVEIATGLLFLGIVMKDFSVARLFTFDFLLLTSFYFIIWSLLVVITVYDIRHKIIPDGLVYAFSAFSFFSILFFPNSIDGTFWGAVLAGLAFFAFFGGLWLVSGGRWLGFGDAKLVLGVGFLLGFANGLSALTLAFWIGAVFSILLLALKHLSRLPQVKAVQSAGLRRRLLTLTMKSEVPFAPFIILGTLIAFFCHIDIFGLNGLF